MHLFQDKHMHARLVANVIHATPRSNPVLQEHALRVRQVSVVVSDSTARTRSSAPACSHCLGHVSAISASGFREEKLVQNVHSQNLPGQQVLGRTWRHCQKSCFRSDGSRVTPTRLGLPARGCCSSADLLSSKHSILRCIWHRYPLDTGGFGSLLHQLMC